MDSWAFRDARATVSDYHEQHHPPGGSRRGPSIPQRGYHHQQSRPNYQPSRSAPPMANGYQQPAAKSHRTQDKPSNGVFANAAPILKTTFDIADAAHTYAKNPNSLSLLGTASSVVNSVAAHKKISKDFSSTNNQSNIGEKKEPDRHSREADDKQLLDSIKCTAEIPRSNLGWNDVAGLENVKQELQIAVEMPRKQPQLFTGKRKACQFILLYGPPGTGKTHIARVLASTVHSKLYVVSVSDMTCKWVGDSARLILLLFKQARENKPAIIFFDEVDSVCGRRDSGRSTTSNHTEQTSELLVQMDGAKFDNSGLLFMGATNLPWNIDPAFLRRFEKKIYVPMPDDAARLQLLELELGQENKPKNFKTYQDMLVERTKGFSGSDIKRIVQEALQMPLRRIETATYFCMWGNGFRVCPGPSKHKNCKGSISMLWNEVPDNTMVVTKIEKEDLIRAITNVLPSVSQEDLQKLDSWKEGLE